MIPVVILVEGVVDLAGEPCPRSAEPSLFGLEVSHDELALLAPEPPRRPEGLIGVSDQVQQGRAPCRSI